MPTIELLTQAHAHLRLRPPATATSHFVQIVAPEFAAAATCCPILFTKDAGTGAFYAGAIFGFKPGESLLGTSEARGGFEPLMFQREGFFMSDRNLAIDRDHERFSASEGEPLFDEAGAPTKSLRAIQRVMGEVSAGLQQTNLFIVAMTELALIEPIDISLTFGAERLTLQGLYTVSLDRLRDVDDPTALRLFRSGHLQLIHVMAASLKQIGRLATLRSLRA
jgi:SapC protein